MATITSRFLYTKLLCAKGEPCLPFMKLLSSIKTGKMKFPFSIFQPGTVSETCTGLRFAAIIPVQYIARNQCLFKFGDDNL